MIMREGTEGQFVFVMNNDTGNRGDKYAKVDETRNSSYVAAAKCFIETIKSMSTRITAW